MRCRVNGLRLEPFQGHELKADDLVSFGGTRDVTRKLKSIVNPFVYRVDVSAGRRATTAHEVVDLANSPVSRPASASEECVCADQEVSSACSPCYIVEGLHAALGGQYTPPCTLAISCNRSFAVPPCRHMSALFATVPRWRQGQDLTGAMEFLRC